MELVKIKQHYQITIPNSLRKLLRLAVGDYMEVKVQDDALVIRPVKVVPSSNEYFFSREWQEKEAEADSDIAAGRVAGPVSNIEEAMKILKNSKS
jgi:AbrB family looped-hinge helix DNA binding protein